MVSSLTKDITSSKKEHFLGIAILLGFLLPHSNTLFLLVNPILCLLLVFSHPKIRHLYPFVLVVVMSILISMILNLQDTSQKALLSTITILLYLICFPFVGQTRIRNVYLYICLSYIIFSQLVYLFGISSLSNIFEQIYPLSEEGAEYNTYVSMRDNLGYDTLFNYRLGGLYHNGNHTAKYLSFLLALFLINNQNRKSPSVLLFSAVAYAGVLFTGSRTGFVVSSLILYFGLFRQKRYAKSLKYIFITLSIIGIGYLLYSGISLRGFDVESGFYNSANYKLFTFLYYLKNEGSIVALLFGHLDSSLFIGQYGLSMSIFDSEYGDIFYCYGFIGFMAFIYCFYKLFKLTDKSYRFFFFVCLWMISSTIIVSFRGFFIFMLFFSVIFNKRKVLTVNSI